ncbi:MAG: hypothetical protein JXR94_15520, partial [Candidatus Hydrogenedentes bacterium]|nr:hypothetical protein [Candidatus Hydrogenedentota bacterium]
MREQWVSLLLGFAVLAAGALSAAGGAAAGEGAPGMVVPFNEAEAVIEWFWSPEVSQFERWRVEDGEAHGLRIWQNWGAVDYEWARRPDSGPALRMTRAFNVDCSRYDRVVIRLGASAGTIVRMIATTDAGERRSESAPVSKGCAEYALDLQGAQRLDTLTLELDAGAEGTGAGWLLCVIVQSTERLEDYARRWDYSGMQWDAHIKGS